jgi:hypothetical protein
MTVHIPTKVRKFADVHATDLEVAVAIFHIASKGEETRVWADPTDAERKAVVQLAFELARPNQNELWWGVEHLTRGA